MPVFSPRPLEAARGVRRRVNACPREERIATALALLGAAHTQPVSEVAGSEPTILSVIETALSLYRQIADYDRAVTLEADGVSDWGDPPPLVLPAASGAGFIPVVGNLVQVIGPRLRPAEWETLRAQESPALQRIAPPPRGERRTLADMLAALATR